MSKNPAPKPQSKDSQGEPKKVSYRIERVSDGYQIVQVIAPSSGVGYVESRAVGPSDMRPIILAKIEALLLAEFK